MLELVLNECGARELGALNCASKYFTSTGITERIARKRVDDHPRADGVEIRPKEHFARLLHFADTADLAMRTSAGLSLGAFHTAVLGVAAAVPGMIPATRPVRRRTDARDFALRRGLGDTDADTSAGTGGGGGGGMYEWGVERQQGNLKLRCREDMVSNPKPHTLNPQAPSHIPLNPKLRTLNPQP